MKNKEYLVSMILVFGINAFTYFFIKLFINEYHIIGHPINNKIPLIPIFIIIYMLWYPYLFFTYYIVYKNNKEKYHNLIKKTILSMIIGNLFYIIYPTMVKRPIIDNYNTLSTLILYIVYKLDYPVNCMPSMHCLLSFLIMFEVIFAKKNNKKFKIFVIITSTLIVLSTLFVKQHVIEDIILALIISIIISLVYRDKFS